MTDKARTDIWQYENKLRAQNYTRIMGLDEVGRGCLAGPVVAAGVILPDRFDASEVKDSKALSAEKRRALAEIIKKEAVYWIIEQGSIALINRLNILWASVDTMRRCAEAEGADPDFLLIDGNKYTDSLIPYQCIVRGDTLSASIAAASIIAKVYRDDLMLELSKVYREFGWHKNAGYGTAEHRRALTEFGYTPHHRPGFKLGTNKVYRNNKT